MARFTINNKGKVKQCKWNCSIKHEHYEGSYESAVKYFGEDPEEIESYGKLINIIIYYQTSDYVRVRRLSNELFDDLVYKQSLKSHFAPAEDRESNAIEALNIAYDMNIIYDERLLLWLRKSEKYKEKYRAYSYDAWIEEVERKGYNLKY